MKYSVFIIILSFFFFTCKKETDRNLFKSSFPENIQRTWIGAEYWSNPMQDWQLNSGRIECIVSGGERNVYLLTHEVDTLAGDFTIKVRLGKLSDSLTQGWVGFNIGIQGEFNDYRSSAVRGEGFPVGITTSGELFIGKKADNAEKINTSFKDLQLKLSAKPKGKFYDLQLVVFDEKNNQLAQIQRDSILPDWIEGGIALVCHSGDLAGFPDKRVFIEYPVWGTKKGTGRNGDVRFWFTGWEVSGSKISTHPERKYGAILFAQYTLSNNVLKITAQMPPMSKKDNQYVEFQMKENNQWKSIAKAQIDTLSRIATFKIENWNSAKDIPYRLFYQYYANSNQLANSYFEGTIRKEPLDKDELVVAAFTGNNDLGFPNNDIVKSIEYFNPDVLFFSGDQIYEGVGGYGAQRTPFNKAVLD